MVRSPSAPLYSLGSQACAFKAGALPWCRYLERGSDVLMWEHLAQHISRASAQNFRITQRHPIGGGALNRTERITDGSRQFFVKYRHGAPEDAFEAEVLALQEIGATGTVRVPSPLCWGATAGSAYVVLEYLVLHPGAIAGEQLGWQLANLHQVARGYFGWTIPNVIGTTPQINTPSTNWAAFWAEYRLRAQATLVAPRHGPLRDGLAQLQEELVRLFRGHEPRPSLLHGDLWSGNYAADGSGQPVLFDLASYYGDRETDIAMTELFGGFPSRFYDAYREALPLDPGYETRRDLYNLYHVLNHLHLFGEGYLPQAERLVATLLAAAV